LVNYPNIGKAILPSEMYQQIYVSTRFLKLVTFGSISAGTAYRTIVRLKDIKEWFRTKPFELYTQKHDSIFSYICKFTQIDPQTFDYLYNAFVGIIALTTIYYAFKILKSIYGVFKFIGSCVQYWFQTSFNVLVNLENEAREALIGQQLKGYEDKYHRIIKIDDSQQTLPNAQKAEYTSLQKSKSVKNNKISKL
jgi:hypothetical protein